MSNEDGIFETKPGSQQRKQKKGHSKTHRHTDEGGKKDVLCKVIRVAAGDVDPVFGKREGEIINVNKNKNWEVLKKIDKKDVASSSFKEKEIQRNGDVMQMHTRKKKMEKKKNKEKEEEEEGLKYSQDLIVTTRKGLGKRKNKKKDKGKEQKEKEEEEDVCLYRVYEEQSRVTRETNPLHQTECYWCTCSYCQKEFQPEARVNRKKNLVKDNMMI